MNTSIRRRLLITLLSTTLVVWAVIALTSYFDARNEIDDLFDAHLAQSARVLMSLVSDELKEELMADSGEEREDRLIAALEEHLSGQRYEHELVFQIWVGGHGSNFHSAGAPTTPLSDIDHGLSDEEIAGQRWRVFTLTDGSIRVQMGELSDVRGELIDQIAIQLLIPLLLGLPLLAVLIWLGIGRSLAPLNQLARDIEGRAPAHLHPIQDNPIPVEARPLVDALNGLFGRLKQAFEREKRLTGDAAHELRTPLAGLKTQAEVARRATNGRERYRALDQIIRGVDRSAHLVEQLLTMARLDPQVGLQDFVQLDLCEIVSDVVVDLSSDADAKQIDVRLEKEYRGSVWGNADILGILVRNLIDNAIRYTPNGGMVIVSITSTDGHVALRIADNGPGIPPEMRDHVFERFFRAHESLAPGSGLGLSIAQRIADLHNASINLKASSHDGLEVEVIFQKVVRGDVEYHRDVSTTD